MDSRRRMVDYVVLKLVLSTLFFSTLISANIDDGLINVIVSLPSGELVSPSSCILVTINDNVRCTGANAQSEDDTRCNPTLLKKFFENVEFDNGSVFLPVEIKLENLNTKEYAFDVGIVLNNGWCHKDNPSGDWIQSGDYLNSHASVADIGNGINETSVALSLEVLRIKTTLMPTTATPKGCLLDGKLYEPGHTRMQDCNTCFCNNGFWGCTLMACVDSITPSPGAVCIYNNEEFSEGSTRKMDCNTCSCGNGMWACTEMACMGPEGTPEPEVEHSPMPEGTSEPEAEHSPMPEGTPEPEAEHSPMPEGTPEPEAEHSPMPEGTSEPEAEHSLMPEGTPEPEAEHSPMPEGTPEPEAEHSPMPEGTPEPEAEHSPMPEGTPEPEAEHSPMPEGTPEPEAEHSPMPEGTPEPEAEHSPMPEGTPEPEAEHSPMPEGTPEPEAEHSPMPEGTPEPEAEHSPMPEGTPEPEAEHSPMPEGTPEPEAEHSPMPEGTPEPEAEHSPMPEGTPEPEAEHSPMPEGTPEPEAEHSPMPEGTPEPEDLTMANRRGCEHNGVFYKPKENRKADDGCNTCFCSDTGVWGCTLMACLPKLCLHNKKIIKEGTSIKVDCNTCHCSGGELACTKMACLGPSAEPEATPEPEYTPMPEAEYATTKSQSGCEHDGVFYKPKENRKADDGCNTCFCSDTGVWGCTLMACLPKLCLHNKKIIKEGTSIKVDCNTCHCSGGELACTKMACLGPSAEPEATPEPEYTPMPEAEYATTKSQSGCTHNDNFYKPKETRMADDGCNHCFCGETGVWGCTIMACLPKKPEVCEYNGVKHNVNEKWSDANDACISCFCAPETPPTVICSTVLCAKPDCKNPIKKPDVCCDFCLPKNISVCHQKLHKANEMLSSDPPMVGVYVPACKDNGDYDDVQCHASSGMCWCSDVNGNEITGTRSRNEPKCNKAPLSKCQQHISNVNKRMPLVGAYMPMCYSNGDYATEQCHGSTGYCWCVDSQGTEIRGSRVRGQSSCKNGVVLEGSIKFSSAALSGSLDKSCLVINVQPNIYCDEPTGNAEGDIPCEIPTIGTITYNDPKFTDGTFNYALTIEQNTYLSFAVTATLNVDWCKDSKSWIKAGDYLNTYSHTFEYKSNQKRVIKDITIDPYGHKARAPMSKCQQASITAQKISPEGLPMLGAFIPKCESDGKYSKKQCHEMYCWCVDSDGIELQGTKQIGNVNCAAELKSAMKLSECQLQKHKASPSDSALPMVGAFIPQCEDNGEFSKVQCHGSIGYCWCVDKNGKEIDGTKTRGTPDCNDETMTNCQQARKIAQQPSPERLPLLGAYIPTCEPNGLYSKMQCHEVYCWCVDSDGVELQGTIQRGNVNCAGELKPAIQLSECQLQIQKASPSGPALPLIGAFKPRCEDNGDFSKVQCHGSIGYCWCVDKNGKEIDGTRTRGTPDCNAGQMKNISECELMRTNALDRSIDSNGMPRLGEFIPECESNGDYSNAQCWSSLNTCWCVDKNGKEIKDSRIKGNSPMCGPRFIINGTITFYPNTPYKIPENSCLVIRLEKDEPCPTSDPCLGPEISKQNYTEPILHNKKLRYSFDFDKPINDRMIIRLVLNMGWCHLAGAAISVKHYDYVNHAGANFTMDTTKRVTEQDIYIHLNLPPFPTPEPESASTCIELRRKAQKTINDRMPIVGVFMPKCEQNGEFSPMQCHGSTGHCWCADKNGSEIPNTRIRGRPFCGKAHFDGSASFSKIAPAFLPSNSCLTITIRENILCTDAEPCEVPLIGKVTYKDPVFKNGRIEFTMHPEVFPPGQYQVSGVLNAGWCQKDGDDEWIRSGDYLNEFAHEFRLAAGQLSVKKELKLDQYISTKPHPTQRAFDPCESKKCRNDTVCIMNPDNGEAKCTCRLGCPFLYEPVCGSNNKKYDNDCLMMVDACVGNQTITIQNLGDCISTTDDSMTCDKMLCRPGSTCITNEDGKGSCVCRPVCPLKFDPVCGSDGMSYPNQCALELSACEHRRNITVVNRGDCPIPKDPCEGYKCKQGKVCFADEDGKPSCVCQQGCPLNFDPVCGSDGITYPNQCSLDSVICESHSSIVALYLGECKPKVSVTGVIMMSDINADITGESCLSVYAEDVSLADATPVLLAKKDYNISSPGGLPQPYKMEFTPLPETRVVEILGLIYKGSCGILEKGKAQYYTDTMFNAYLSDDKNSHYVDVKLVKRENLPSGCVDDDGKVRQSTESWSHPKDPCMTCGCNPDGVARCDKLYCDVPSCANSIIKKGDCCLSCPNNETQVAVVNQIVVDGMIMMPDMDADIVGDACLTVYAEDVSLADVSSIMLTHKRYNISSPWSPKFYQLKFTRPSPATVVVGISADVIDGSCSQTQKGKTQYFTDTIFNFYLSDKEKNMYYKDVKLAKQVQSPTVLVCLDQNNVKHDVNEVWTDPKDVCTTCVCGEDGKKQCDKIFCGLVMCDNAVIKEGDCCPSCPENSPLGCADEEGMLHQSNESWTHPKDKCMMCACDPDGIAQCDKIYCGIPFCANYSIKEGDCCPSCPDNETLVVVDDRITVDGMLMMSDITYDISGDACLSVFAEDVSIADALATKMAERRYNLSNPWRPKLYQLEFEPLATTTVVSVSAQIVKGLCGEPEQGNAQYFTDTMFNIFLSDKQKKMYYMDVKLVKYVESPVWFGCVDDAGNQRRSNETWTDLKDVCTMCSCNDGQKQCDKIYCGVVLCDNAIIKDGDCCPSCPEGSDKCIDSNGLIRSPLETWTDPQDPCLDCGCRDDGTIGCSTIYCDVPTCKGAFIKEGDCCPGCPEPQFHTVEGSIMLPDLTAAIFINNSCLHVYVEDVSLADAGAILLGEKYYQVSDKWWISQPYSIDFKPTVNMVVGRVAATMNNASCSNDTKTDVSFFTDTIFSFQIGNGTIKNHYADVKLVPLVKDVVLPPYEISGSISFPKSVTVPKGSCLLVIVEDISLADMVAPELGRDLLDLDKIDLSMGQLTYNVQLIDGDKLLKRRVSVRANLAVGRCNNFGIRYGDYHTESTLPVDFGAGDTRSFIVDVSLTEYSTNKTCSLKGYFRIYSHNTTFSHPGKRCLDCKCFDGTVICERKQCMRLSSCNETIIMEGECCPKCASLAVCEDQKSGSIYKPGETAYLDREPGSCVECICEGNGAFKCETKGCERLSCLNVVQPSTSCCPVCAKDIKCKHPITGELYKAGEKWQNGPNGCHKCTCTKDGVIECTRPKCQKIGCESTILQGYCCPVCVDHLQRLPGAATVSDYVRIMKPSFLGTEIAERSSSCQDPLNDKVYAVGERWSDNCMRYQCTEDGLTAANVPCPALACLEKDMVKVPGSCCSICKDTEIATVRCLNDKMIVHLPRSVLEPVAITQLSLLDAKCRGSQNATHYTFNTTLKDCGTIVTSTDGIIRYSNMITTMAANGKNGMVSRVVPVELPFSCVYRRRNTMVLPTAFRPRLSKPQTLQESSGEFNFNIELTNRAGLRLDASSVMDISVGEKIFVHVTGSGLKHNGVRVSVRKCFVTPSFDPADPVNHTLIDDGCAVDETVRFLPSSDAGQRFSFDSFLFTHHMESLFYIHCTSITCDEMDTNSFCASGCQNARMARRKRDITMEHRYPSDLSATIGFLN